MARQPGVRTTDFEPIDRLEEKIRLLVEMVTRLRGLHAQAAEDNARLAQENEVLRERLGSAQGHEAEVDTLRGERDAIRGRVAEMLSQLESI